MTLSVICAGFPRTGTMSLKLALEALGVGRCHHMSELYGHPDQWPLWRQALSGKAVDWESVFAGYGAAADVPACAFYRELASAFPNAKIIVTTRDSQQWLVSAQATILSPTHQGQIAKSPVADVVQLMTRRLIGHLTEAAGPNGGAALLNPAVPFAAYPDYVRRSLPGREILVYDVAEGWEPLSKFLGVPNPAAPFPNINKRSEFTTVIQVPALA